MAVRLLSSNIRWIFCISMLPWLLTFGLGHSVCEAMKTVQCGKTRRSQNCNTETCVLKEAESIQRGYVLWSHHCQGGKYPKYGYKNNYIWTTDCCIILARICYKAKSINSGEDFADDKTTSHGQVTPPQVTDLDEWFTTPVDVFNSTGMIEMEEETMPTNFELKAEDTETKSAMIGLYAGLPVGLFLFVAVLAVVCFVFRDKLKTVAEKFRKAHKEGLYQQSSAYTTTKLSTENDISRKFANQEYAMHDGKENEKSENESRGVYEFAKSWSEPEQNVPSHHNPVQTGMNSSCSKYRPEYEEVVLEEPSNTYDTIHQAVDRERFDPSYDHIAGSNLPATETPQRNDRGTEYDNAVV